MTPSFSPSPARADAVIDELATPESSLESVARNHDTTVEALSLWLITPAIRERLDSLTLSHALHLKLAALAALPKAIDALRSILEAFPYEERHSRTNPAHTAAVEAPRVNARRAAGLLFRIARFVLPDTAPRGHRAETPRQATQPQAPAQHPPQPAPQPAHATSDNGQPLSATPRTDSPSPPAAHTPSECPDRATPAPQAPLPAAPAVAPDQSPSSTPHRSSSKGSKPTAGDRATSPRGTPPPEVLASPLLPVPRAPPVPA